MNYAHVYVIYNPEKPDEILVYNSKFSQITGLDLYNGFIDPDIYAVVIKNMQDIASGVTPPSGEITLNGMYTSCLITYRSALSEFEFKRLKQEYKNTSMDIKILNKEEEDNSNILFDEGFGGIRKLIIFPSLTILKENRVGKPVKSKEYMYRLQSENELVKELKR